MTDMKWMASTLACALLRIAGKEVALLGGVEGGEVVEEEVRRQVVTIHMPCDIQWNLC